MSNVLGTGGIKLESAVGRCGHGDVGAGFAVDVLDDIGDGSLQLAAGHNELRLKGDALDVSAGDEHGRSGTLSRSGRARRRSRGARDTVGSCAVRLAVGIALGAPDWSDVGALPLGARELGEEIMRLGIESRLGDLGLLLLASGFSGHWSGPRAGRLVGGLGGEVLVGDILNGDGVSFNVLLEKLLSGGELSAIGSVGVFGSHDECSERCAKSLVERQCLGGGDDELFAPVCQQLTSEGLQLTSESPVGRQGKSITYLSRELREAVRRSVGSLRRKQVQYQGRTVGVGFLLGSADLEHCADADRQTMTSDQ